MFPLYFLSVVVYVHMYVDADLTYIERVDFNGLLTKHGTYTLVYVETVYYIDISRIFWTHTTQSTLDKSPRIFVTHQPI